MSVPLGPLNVIGVVATGAHSEVVPSGWPCRCPPPFPWSPPTFAAAASAASIEDAVAAPTPSRPSLRIASRRVMIPSAWSSATSSARYFCSSVIRTLPS